AWIRMIAYLGIPILFFLYFASVSFSAVTAGTVAVITLMGFLTSIFGIISIAILIPVMLLCLYFGLRAAYWFKEYLKISTMKPFEKEELGNSILLWGGGYLILDILLYLGMIFTPFGGILSAFVGVLDFLFPLMLYSGLGYLMYKNTTKK
ncbi:MAG: hypothetical protein NTX03_05640, partial [Bacteroidetes bacterium]|nr:hypothetical protein [Bacteroidota bacterium]